MKFSTKNKQKWLDIGYEHFALYGPEKLSINKISKELKLSRASFYHYFGDIDAFIEELLNVHWNISQYFNFVGKKECKKFYPDLYVLLGQNTLPLKFSRQLFINRNIPTFNYLFNKTYKESAITFILKLFSEKFDLKNNEATYNLWLTVGESWCSRLDINDLSPKKMHQLSEDIMKSVLKFISSDLYSNIQISGKNK